MNSKGHLAYFLPKFHCELNPIERVYMGPIEVLYKGILEVHNTEPSDQYSTWFRLCIIYVTTLKRQESIYMFAYLEEVPVGSDLENRVKMYKKSITSHKRVSDLQ